jgi:hypothetical protein
LWVAPSKSTGQSRRPGRSGRLVALRSRLEVSPNPSAPVHVRQGAGSRNAQLDRLGEVEPRLVRHEHVGETWPLDPLHRQVAVAALLELCADSGTGTAAVADP